MKPKQCKVCKAVFTPKQYASCKTKCEVCIFVYHKQKLCDYQKKQLENKKPQKPLKIKIDKEQVRVNALVRKRDEGKPCISCGKEGIELEAGHYISRARSPKMRYDIDNIHGQCWHCNNILHGNEKGFSKGLVMRYSKEYLENLDNRLLKENEILVKKFSLGSDCNQN